jgi:hypothetical protein
VLLSHPATSGHEHRDHGGNHGEAVIEEAQHKNGMQAARCGDGGDDGERRGRIAEDGGGRPLHHAVCGSEEILRGAEIGTVISEPPQRVKEVDEACRVDERPGAAAELRVVALSVSEAAHLAHVCLPIDLGV